MAFLIQPKLGIGSIRMYSIYDGAIDWGRSTCTPQQYVQDCIAHRGNLALYADQTPAEFRFRAPTEKDLLEIDTTRHATVGEKVVEQRDEKKEHVALFRRCLQSITGYIHRGQEVQVERVFAPDGSMWASESLMEHVPVEIMAELGARLRMTQTFEDNLKND